MKYKLTLVASSILLAVSPILHAEETVSVFDEVVVSGTRSEQSVKNVPASVAKISSEDIEQNMATDVQQALKFEPGVSAQGQGRFGVEDFNIRGMSGSRVKVLVDGVEQMASYNPGADAMRKNSNTFEVDTLTAIEVNKGPSSSLYGSDALGGTVLMRTKNPEDLLGDGDDSHIGLKTGYASANTEYKATVEAANRTGDLETMLIYTYRDGNETQTHGSGADINGEERGAADPFSKKSHNVLAKAFYQLNDAHRIGLTGEYYTRTAKGQTLSKEDTAMNMSADGSMKLHYSDVRTEDTDQRGRIGFEHEWQANNVAFDQLKWSLNYQQSKAEHNNYDRTKIIMNKPPMPPVEMDRGKRNRFRSGEDSNIQFDGQFDKELAFDNSRHELTYGLSYSDSKFKLDYYDYWYDKNETKQGTPEVPEAKTEKRALFVQDQMFFMEDALVVTAGARYDMSKITPDSDSGFKANDNDALTSRLGAVYHWNQQVSTFAQFSQGFRVPTMQELYYVRDGGTYKVVSNPDLKPEESQSYEMGLRASAPAGNLELVAFYNDYKNFITQADKEMVNGVEIYTNKNIAKAKIYGAELKANIWLDEAFSAPVGTYSKFSVAYQDGEGEDPTAGTTSSLNDVAPLTSVVGLGYDAPSDNWGGLMSVTMVASKKGSDWDTKDNLDAPGYSVVDLTAYYRPMKDMTLRAGLFNALDKKYWNYQDVAGRTDTKGIDRRTQPGRNWGVNLDYAF